MRWLFSSRFLHCQVQVAYLEGVGVVARAHAGYLACILDRLIDELDHADVAEFVVLVDGLGHPLEPVQRAVVLEVLVEPGGVGVLHQFVSSLPLPANSNLNSN